MTTVFLVEIEMNGPDRISDILFPEWGTLRFHQGDVPDACNSFGQAVSGTPFPVTGPHSIGMQFAIGTSRQWGVTFQPLGWAACVGLPAHVFSNAILDGHVHRGFAAFRPLAETLFGPEPDEAGELDRIMRFLEDLPKLAVPRPERVRGIYIGLLGEDIRSVDDLARRCAVSKRTLERVCSHSIGFPPKLLLRRQRFMRSLTQFAADPSLRWIGAMDAQYHDQAQFVRDFRHFMGMTPSEFAARDKPILGPAMRERHLYIREMVTELRRQGDRSNYGVADL